MSGTIRTRLISNVSHRGATRGRQCSGWRFLRNGDGAAAVEFALLVPLLLLLFVGIYEGSRVIELDRRFSQVTSMTGDLVSREQDLGADPAATIKGILKVIDHILGANPGGSLEIEIIPVMGFGEDGTDTRTYAPSYKRAKDGTISISRPRCTAYDLPAAGLLGVGDSTIIVEAKFEYTPLAFAKSMFPSMSWKEKSAHSPRHGCVDFEDNNCSVSCP